MSNKSKGKVKFTHINCKATSVTLLVLRKYILSIPLSILLLDITSSYYFSPEGTVENPSLIKFKGSSNLNLNE